MSEKRLQAAVVELATFLRWRSYHAFDSRRSAAGFPDLVLAREGRLMFVELKAKKGRLTQEQREWLAALRRCSVEVHVWRPRDWDDGTVQRALSGEGP